jgi:hypothetical protein
MLHQAHFDVKGGKQSFAAPARSKVEFANADIGSGAHDLPSLRLFPVYRRYAVRQLEPDLKVSLVFQ